MTTDRNCEPSCSHSVWASVIHPSWFVYQELVPFSAERLSQHRCWFTYLLTEENLLFPALNNNLAMKTRVQIFGWVLVFIFSGLNAQEVSCWIVWQLISEGYLLYDSICRTLFKWTNCQNEEHVRGCLGWRGVCNSKEVCVFGKGQQDGSLWQWSVLPWQPVSLFWTSCWGKLLSTWHFHSINHNNL